MRAPQIRQFSVRQIHHKLAERVFAVPKLQREFVWDGRKAAALLDSMYKNMPIGMILVWETRRKHYDLLRQTLHILPPFNTDNPNGLFLIDGQQRLSVLHEAREGGVKKNSSGKQIDFGRICFVLDPDPEEYDPQRFAYRKPMARRFVAIQDILSSNWRRHLVGYTKPLLNRVAVRTTARSMSVNARWRPPFGGGKDKSPRTGRKVTFTDAGAPTAKHLERPSTIYMPNLV